MNAMVIGGVLVVAALIEGIVILEQASTIGGLKERQEQYQNKLAQKTLDLKSCTEVKTELRTQYDACLEQVRVSQDEALHARESVAKLAQTISLEADHVRKERAVIYRLPGCKELAELDVAAACPDIAGSLRDRAAAYVSAAGEGSGPNP